MLTLEDMACRNPNPTFQCYTMRKKLVNNCSLFFFTLCVIWQKKQYDPPMGIVMSHIPWATLIDYPAGANIGHALIQKAHLSHP